MFEAGAAAPTGSGCRRGSPSQDDEPAAWRRVAAALSRASTRDTGLFEQFRGYFGLEEVDCLEHGGCATPMDVCLGRERTRSPR